MTMANIKLIHAEERPTKLFRKQPLTEEELSSLRIRVGLILQYKDDVDSVGLQLDIAYMLSEDTIVLEYEALFVVENDEWLNFMKTNPSIEEIQKYSGDMFDIALGYARSSIAAKTDGTAFKSLYLPVFNKEQYTKTVFVKKIEDAA